MTLIDKLVRFEVSLPPLTRQGAYPYNLVSKWALLNYDRKEFYSTGP
jgi:hypothetical protein